MRLGILKYGGYFRFRLCRPLDAFHGNFSPFDWVGAMLGLLSKERAQLFIGFFSRRETRAPHPGTLFLTVSLLSSPIYGVSSFAPFP